MRRFSLYLRKGVYYAQLYNPKSGMYMHGHSTGIANRDEAAGIATDWLKNGIPVPKKREKRSIETRMTLDAIHAGLHTLALAPDEVQKIVDILKSRDLLDSAIVASAASSQVLYVNHSWSWFDGLKCTKTGKVRVVPLLGGIREELIKLAEFNPHGKDGFIFYGLVPEKPMDTHFLLDGLKDALAKIGISEEERARRNIVFHSWRHYFATKMRSKLDPSFVKRATGHSTDAMLEHYTEHEREEDIDTLLTAADDMFGNIIPFERKSA